ncbi:hypothetical protein M3A49_01055 [Paraburkholderia sp. CNPSo 3076]|uniref:hypothetical protein n=1 Tax=Paraburkholderia sp. CNPSo 3076 TaxID=2940936 RepID=UPI0022516B39|nr:hypothetical protein [Paraburkholderia sp. CNPSo 3076]MCX5538099.1 hypothetical protein [Paraburkholderia sp. CNPSo 3076]
MKRYLFAARNLLALAGVLGCSGCPIPPGPANTVVIYYREPFDFQNYWDPLNPNGNALETGQGSTVPFISVTCIENHTTGPFHFDPTMLVVNLGNSVPAYSGLLTATGRVVVVYGQYWNPPSALGMYALDVSANANFTAPQNPVSFNAITNNADTDPNDQPGSSIQGDSNHVSRHVVSYCTNASDAWRVGWQCTPPLNQNGQYVFVQTSQVDANGNGFDPVWVNSVYPQDFAAAQIRSDPPLVQNLAVPSCP